MGASQERNWAQGHSQSASILIWSHYRIWKRKTFVSLLLPGKLAFAHDPAYIHNFITPSGTAEIIWIFRIIFGVDVPKRNGCHMHELVFSKHCLKPNTANTQRRQNSTGCTVTGLNQVGSPYTELLGHTHLTLEHITNSIWHTQRRA